MSGKMILAAILISVLVLYAAYWIGGYIADEKATAQCSVDRAQDKGTYQAGQMKAVDAARRAQKSADAELLAKTQDLLRLAQAEAVRVQKSASEAKALADRLSGELTRLKNEDPDVKTWNDTCLPDPLLRSLHGAKATAAGNTCR